MARSACLSPWPWSISSTSPPRAPASGRAKSRCARCSRLAATAGRPVPRRVDLARGGGDLDRAGAASGAALPTLPRSDMTIRYLGGDGICCRLILSRRRARGLYPALYLARFQPARVLKRTVGGHRKAPGACATSSSSPSSRCRSGSSSAPRSPEPDRLCAQRRSRLSSRRADRDRRDVPLGAAAAARDLLREIGAVDGVVSHAARRSASTPGAWRLMVTRPGRPERRVRALPRRSRLLPTLGIRRLAGRTFNAALAMDDSTIVRMRRTRTRPRRRWRGAATMSF